MNEAKSIAGATILFEDKLQNRCPLCGRIITTIYPEIAPGLRYAHCQHGHKIRLQTEDHQERNAG